MTTQRTEPTFWAVHLSGQDDTYPAPTREEADAACLLINAAIARQTPPGHPVDVTAPPSPGPTHSNHGTQACPISTASLCGDPSRARIVKEIAK